MIPCEECVDCGNLVRDTEIGNCEDCGAFICLECERFFEDGEETLGLCYTCYEKRRKNK